MDSVRAVHFNTPDQLVTASEDCTIKVWDINYVLNHKQADFEPIYTLRGHTGPIISMTGADFNKNQWLAGTIFSGSRDGSLAIWRVPIEAVFDVNDPYLESEDETGARQVAVWDKCHEDQPIWDI